jgi:DNA-binding transcriptional LysR family regulator
MPRSDLNRSGEMEVFVRIVETGSFSAAARTFRMTPSAISKLITRLEARLGVRLFDRSTRKLQLTPEGTLFHERSARVLRDLDAVELDISPGVTPQGLLRVNVNVPFGHHCFLPLVPDFLALYPQIKLEVTLTDAVVDLLDVRADVAIRTGPLRESRLVARKLGETRPIVVASPAYLKRYGTPRKPSDLPNHNLLGFSFTRHVKGWRFVDRAGRGTTIVPEGNVVVSDGDAMRRLAVASVGIARLLAYELRPDITAGRLVPLLESYDAGDVESVHAVFVGQDGRMPARVRALLDYLVANVRL